MRQDRTVRILVRASLAVALVVCSSVAALAVIDLDLVAKLHASMAEHIDQMELMEQVQAGHEAEAFEQAFTEGDELFEVKFISIDGVGANVGTGERFTRVPRGDLKGAGEWANHTPTRFTGPNAAACDECHSQPVGDGSGNAALPNHRDPLHTGDPALFIHRDTPHIFGAGALQVLAEEMTADLHAARDQGQADACASGKDVVVPLMSKGVSFGSITASCGKGADASALEGISDDLIVRPYQWKGENAFLRDFNRGAAHQELGIQPVETTGDGIDGDFDGVVDEFTVGDVTGLTVYIAAQPKPTTLIELAAVGIIDPLPAEQVEAINKGENLFATIGCADCHRQVLVADNPVFSEPSQYATHRDEMFPAGQDPRERGLDPANPVSFNLLTDHPDNITCVQDASGTTSVVRVGSFEDNGAGGANIRLLGDLKRHDMGPELAEAIDELGTGASVFVTENLWGVGSTAPYLHDARATTITGAIEFHGGEAAEARDNFRNLPDDDQAAIIAYLENQVIFKAEEEEEEEEEEGEPAPIVDNGDFDIGLKPWRFTTNGAGTATQADGAASIAITAAGTNVQLFQRGIEVHGGVTYAATFTASNTAGRDVRVRLMDHTTFADLGLDVVVDLTEEPQRFSIDFTVPAGLDSTNARLTFWMGPFDAPGTTYTYDAVGVDEVCGVTNLVP